MIHSHYGDSIRSEVLFAASSGVGAMPSSPVSDTAKVLVAPVAPVVLTLSTDGPGNDILHRSLSLLTASVAAVQPAPVSVQIDLISSNAVTTYEYAP